MNKKFFPELARRLRQEGIATGPSEKDRLPVLLDNQEVMWVEPQGHRPRRRSDGRSESRPDLLYRQGLQFSGQ